MARGVAEPGRRSVAVAIDGLGLDVTISMIELGLTGL